MAFEWYTQAEPYLIPLQLGFAMFGMGATLKLKDFIQVVRHPSGVALGMGLQWIFVPLMAFAFIHIFGLSPGWAVGILLVAVTPGGAFSNLLTFLVRGHTALSIAVTLVATLGTIISVPLILKLLAGNWLPAGFTLPVGRIIVEVFVYLVLPMSIGMVFYKFLPKRSLLISKISVWISVGFIATLVIGAVGSGRIKVGEYGWVPPAILTLYGLTIHFLSGEICRLLKRYDDETLALNVEVSVRNIGVGLLMVPHFFPGQEAQGQALYSLLFFAGIQMFIPIPLLIRHRIGKSPLWFRKARPRPREEE